MQNLTKLCPYDTNLYVSWYWLQLQFIARHQFWKEILTLKCPKIPICAGRLGSHITLLQYYSSSFTSNDKPLLYELLFRACSISALRVITLRAESLCSTNHYSPSRRLSLCSTSHSRAKAQIGWEQTDRTNQSFKRSTTLLPALTATPPSHASRKMQIRS